MELGQKRPDARPRISVLFHFGSHHMYPDARPIRDSLDTFKPHIYVFENATATRGDNRKVEARFAEEKRNSMDPDWLDPSVPFRKSEQVIVGSAPVQVMGVEEHFWPVSIYLRHLKKRQEKADDAATKALNTGDIAKAVNHIQKSDKLFEKITTIRDRNIVKRLKNFVAKVVRQHPELHSEEEIRVLFRLGELHGGAYWPLIGQPGIKVKRKYDFPTPHMARRPQRVGNEERVRRIVSSEVRGQILHRMWHVPYGKAEALAQALLKQVSTETIREFLKHHHEVPRGPQRQKDFDKWMERHAIEVPKSIQDFEDSFEMHVKSKYADWSEPYIPND